ncbi:MAG: NADH-quinone oxidoreductase subunit J [Thermonemataceae bacterium]|nr:NADH-quinone oxidoreductase subunit J [Thermonemataceae bacterium]
MDYIFYFFLFLLIMSTFFISISKNLLYAVFALLLSFLSLASLYVFLGADFVAASQVVIYVGGILVLLVFGVMLANRQEHTETIISENLSKISSIILSIAFFAIIGQEIFRTEWATMKVAHSSGVQQIGIALLNQYVLAFELIGVLLLVALVGASWIASQKESFLT